MYEKMFWKEYLCDVNKYLFSLNNIDMISCLALNVWFYKEFLLQENIISHWMHFDKSSHSICHHNDSLHIKIIVHLLRDLCNIFMVVLHLTLAPCLPLCVSYMPVHRFLGSEWLHSISLIKLQFSRGYLSFICRRRRYPITPCFSGYNPRDPAVHSTHYRAMAYPCTGIYFWKGNKCWTRPAVNAANMLLKLWVLLQFSRGQHFVQ